MFRIIITLILFGLVSKQVVASERDFYLPESDSPYQQQDDHENHLPFENLNKVHIGDHQTAYSQWVNNVASFENSLQQQPDIAESKFDVDKAWQVMSWYENRSAELLYLARGYRWLKDSSKEIIQHTNNKIRLSEANYKAVNNWYQGAHRGLAYAVETMPQIPKDYAMLTLVLTGTQNNARYKQERLWAISQVNRQLMQLKTRVNQVKGYLKIRSAEMRESIELEQVRQVVKQSF